MKPISERQHTQLNNRNSTGQWNYRQHGDVDDSADVLGVDDRAAGHYKGVSRGNRHQMHTPSESVVMPDTIEVQRKTRLRN